MIERSAEDGYRIQFFPAAKHLFQRFVDEIAAIRVPQPPAPVGTEIRDGGYFAVGMLMPVKGGSESPSHNSQLDLFGGGRSRPARL
jgi:hypothetical protein